MYPHYSAMVTPLLPEPWKNRDEWHTADDMVNWHILSRPQLGPTHSFPLWFIERVFQMLTRSGPVLGSGTQSRKGLVPAFWRFPCGKGSRWSWSSLRSPVTEGRVDKQCLPKGKHPTCQAEEDFPEKILTGWVGGCQVARKKGILKEWPVDAEMQRWDIACLIPQAAGS